MTRLALVSDEHPTILATEYQSIKPSLTDTEALLLACLTNVLNELPTWLDGDYGPGSALDHASFAINAVLYGPGLPAIPPNARASVQALRAGEA